ncbi:MAG TPA: glycosyl transferase family A [Candidatus Omnitrophica bacterium]|nr:glycosyl transferase family A [Candidatus Omnitrophota bacterium]
MPRVSVNICCYNGEKYIAETIQSVLDQTYSDFELIVINDGSKDASEKVILGIKDERIKYFRQENKGLSETRNRAISLSSGEFIAILDQDDVWETEKLAQQVNLMDTRPAVGVVYTDAYPVNAKGDVLGIRGRDTYFTGQLVPALLRNNFICCPTVMFRAACLKRIPGFRTDLKIAEEYDLYLRLSRICDFACVERPLARYRLHAGNTSGDMVRDYSEAIVCLADFASAENNDRLRKIAVRYADYCRLRLAAALIWKERRGDVPDVLKVLSSGYLVRLFGFVLEHVSVAPSWFSRILLLPLKYAGIV